MVPSEENHKFNVENSTIQTIFALFYALYYALISQKWLLRPYTTYIHLKLEKTE